MLLGVDCQPRLQGVELGLISGKTAWGSGLAAGHSCDKRSPVLRAYCDEYQVFWRYLKDVSCAGRAPSQCKVSRIQPLPRPVRSGRRAFLQSRLQVWCALQGDRLATNKTARILRSTYLSKVTPGKKLVGFKVATCGCLGYVQGNRWSGWFLIPTESLKVVAHELLIE
jgi:hypothetical protein